jgi:hypothetical protein
MNILITVFVMAFLVEALVEYGKLIFKGQINWTQLIALLIGVGLAFLFDANLFALLGIPMTLPIAGVILTGVLGSRGANYLADVVKKLQQMIGGGINTNSGDSEDAQ